ncbi:DEAD/DEAH box helicase [Pilimelia columellifera]|uniref:DEAD/DEAH box helicase n=1 Tax=Pilimelia columellifera subsp. columellifera TaxID=706583 RepID=A0ABP6AGN0_9ACTN
MARIAVSVAEAAVSEHVSTSAVLAAREVADEVEMILWNPASGVAIGQRLGSGAGIFATIHTDSDGAVADVTGRCECRATDCLHAVALAVRAAESLSPRLPAPRRTAPDAASWEATLATWSGASVDEPDPDEGPTIALQVALEEQRRTWPRQRGSGGRSQGWQVRLQPVVPGRTGWIRGGVDWTAVSYGAGNYRRGARALRHWAIMEEIADYTADQQDYYSSSSGRMLGLCGRRIWQMLAEARDCGVPFVQPGKSSGPVTLGGPARVEIRARRVRRDLQLTPTVIVDGQSVAPDAALAVGQPPHGLVWWATCDEPAAGPKGRALRLSPLDQTVAVELLASAGKPVRIPAAQESRFFQTHFAPLAGRAPVVAADDQVRLPDLGAVTLTLSLAATSRQLLLRWSWHTPVGDDVRHDELWSPSPAVQAEARAEIIGRVTPIVADVASELLDDDRLAATRALTGDPMIRVLRELTPALDGCDGVAIDSVDGQLPVEADAAPVIAFDDAGTGGQDWFDLAVNVTVGDESVNFEDLFTALATDREFLLLPNGSYVLLDQPEFRQLRDLIVESREMTDAPAGALRLGRLSPGVWQELAELGAVTGQAAAWQESIMELAEAGAGVDAPTPAGLEATLRPYQERGFGWLAALYSHRLGGILADDMGLGKTMQALALMLHVRAKDPATPPFLVVAPASVVSNWAIEAARFAPGLTVAAIGQTAARRGAELAESVAGADLVVTSYTLLRLEFDEYQQLPWAGLILDEAQFVKNPGTQAYRCARDLPAPVKLAITGTPMENHLLDLWALLSITAPGLFPRADRFTEHYRNPIEKQQDSARLDQLRRRIRPFMLRRRKDDVATDLPAKQEQVLELELHPRHQKIYQKYLQRERQKVLGLLGDLEQNRFEIFRSLTMLRQASLDVSLVDGKHATVPSTKLDELVERVCGLAEEGHRTLVFSQFTRFLDAARSRLTTAGLDVCYLDGKTRDRASVIQRFKDGGAPAFLISLKAGGFGLNLTEADYCILLDPWWNPAAEAQAVDRIHRIGQTRSVMVYRMVAKGTIEEKVMALQARKADLFASVVDGGDFASARLTADDIRNILA